MIIASRHQAAETLLQAVVPFALYLVQSFCIGIVASCLLLHVVAETHLYSDGHTTEWPSK